MRSSEADEFVQGGTRTYLASPAWPVAVVAFALALPPTAVFLASVADGTSVFSNPVLLWLVAAVSPLLSVALVRQAAIVRRERHFLCELTLPGSPPFSSGEHLAEAGLVLNCME